MMTNLSKDVIARIQTVTGNPALSRKRQARPSEDEKAIAAIFFVLGWPVTVIAAALGRKRTIIYRWVSPCAAEKHRRTEANRARPIDHREYFAWVRKRQKARSFAPELGMTTEALYELWGVQ